MYGDKFEDINFNELPNQFVLKCTHDSGGLVVCKDKSKLDLKKARKKSKNLWQTIIIFGRGSGHIKGSNRELLLKNIWKIRKPENSAIINSSVSMENQN